MQQGTLSTKYIFNNDTIFFRFIDTIFSDLFAENYPLIFPYKNTF